MIVVVIVLVPDVDAVYIYLDTVEKVCKHPQQHRLRRWKRCRFRIILLLSLGFWLLLFRPLCPFLPLLLLLLLSFCLVSLLVFCSYLFILLVDLCKHAFQIGVDVIYVVRTGCTAEVRVTTARGNVRAKYEVDILNVDFDWLGEQIQQGDLI